MSSVRLISCRTDSEKPYSEFWWFSNTVEESFVSFSFIFFNLILRSLSIPKSSYFGSEFWPVSQLIALFVISNLNRTRQRNNAHKIEKIISWQKSFTNFWILGIPEQITWTRLRQKYKLNIDEKRISYMLIVLDYDIVRKTVLELHTWR